MPKTKKLESDSDSDSGPDDRHPSKKSKTESGSKSGKAPQKTNDDGDPIWELGSRKRITVRSFKGAVYVDIREFYEKDGKMLPGKKGIALKAGDWNLLKDLTDSIDEAIRDK